MTSLTLMEVYIEDASASKFVSAMKRQFARAKTEKALNYMINVYDDVVDMVNNNFEDLQGKDGFFKFHYKLALADFKQGNLDYIPSGKDLAKDQMVKLKVQDQRMRQPTKQKSFTPEEEAESMRKAVYGQRHGYKNPLGT